MSKATRARLALPLDAQERLQEIGRRLRIARKRRRITQSDMARRMFVTEKTLSRLETGDPGVGLGVFFSALSVLDLIDQTGDLVHPDRDGIGGWLDRRRLPERVHPDEDEDIPGLDF